MRGRVVLILAVPAKPSVFGEPRYDAGAGPFKVGPGAVIGDYKELVAERQKHRALWQWCADRGIEAPSPLAPLDLRS